MPFSNLVGICLFALVVVYAINYVRHRKELDLFYDTLDDMSVNFYKIYPYTDNDYFWDLVEPEITAKWKVWQTDYNYFIFNHEKLKELYDGNQEWLKKKNKKPSILICPWCGNTTVDRFVFSPYKENSDTGLIVCLDCKAGSPSGKINEKGFFSFDDEKVTKHNAKL